MACSRFIDLLFVSSANQAKDGKENAVSKLLVPPTTRLTATKAKRRRNYSTFSYVITCITILHYTFLTDRASGYAIASYQKAANVDTMHSNNINNSSGSIFTQLDDKNGFTEALSLHLAASLLRHADDMFVDQSSGDTPVNLEPVFSHVSVTDDNVEERIEEDNEDKDMNIEGFDGCFAALKQVTDMSSMAQNIWARKSLFLIKFCSIHFHHFVLFVSPCCLFKCSIRGVNHRLPFTWAPFHGLVTLMNAPPLNRLLN